MNLLSLHESVLSVLSSYDCPTELIPFFYYAILICALIFDIYLFCVLSYLISVFIRNLIFGKLKHCLFIFSDGFTEYRLCLEKLARSKKFVYRFVRKNYTSAELCKVVCFDSYEQLTLLGHNCLSAVHYNFNNTGEVDKE